MPQQELSTWSRSNGWSSTSKLKLQSSLWLEPWKRLTRDSLNFVGVSQQSITTWFSRMLTWVALMPLRSGLRLWLVLSPRNLYLSHMVSSHTLRSTRPLLKWLTGLLAPSLSPTIWHLYRWLTKTQMTLTLSWQYSRWTCASTTMWWLYLYRCQSWPRVS